MLFVDTRHFHYSGCSPIHDVFFEDFFWILHDCHQEETWEIIAAISRG